MNRGFSKFLRQGVREKMEGAQGDELKRPWGKGERELMERSFRGAA